MRDRLIESLKDSCKYDRCLGKQDTDICKDCQFGGEIADHILADGWIRPPCKVGQEVYWINRVTKKVETDVVVAIHQYEDGLSITTSNRGRKEVSTYTLSRFLEIMHFTKEEAERALAERSEK